MRIAYVLLTCEKYMDSRVIWQHETCLASVPREDIYYLGHTTDESRRLFNWGARDGYRELPEKMRDVFLKMAFDEYDWIFIADDDTYIFHERIQQFLSLYTASVKDSRIVFGHTLDHVKHKLFEYYSGGAGTILTKALYDEVRIEIKRYDNPIIHWCADICLGKWLLDAKKRLSTANKPVYMINLPDFLHPQKLDIAKNNPHTALTFHHLKERDDYLILRAFELRK